MRTNLRTTFTALTVAGIVCLVGGCSSSTATPTPNLGSSTTEAASPSSEYLTLVRPVDATQEAFKASKTLAELRTRAGPFAAALQKWQGELSAVTWPASAQPAINTLETDIPPFIPGLDELSAGSIDSGQFALHFGRLATALSLAAAAARRDLGLPPL